ncbi:TfoX/Sxy family protein [Rhodospirillum rubrum]|uniref:TfoX N-terminal domain-containing protein n=1 Tax=Rhodospirillum rubrum (strain ATCC 11170 / ATH 1.1.1 / DSM 467 / LMG 4362 / NCIMB 8255 / S1) TaxID=269796 RepID=Q2RS88_RHORT|nr:TfoX/Sxy family protein [Rhodospirillum rubrum]ABC23007.1 conserved hypothetical protein [Rhodospirillum rubrum ATCC 11170]AEO48736.1 hypothetical protein F11_11360 [Rhodospirillum rubrum F11]MBK5954630.1 hypothetical protein [Rhodospirillum rubrum]QXG78991.1 TfoX/Sxy family protein [Rhodospirillum rubrum]HAQ00173.1 hypothetical protein [Rhodospirillum rubrum]
MDDKERGRYVRALLPVMRAALGQVESRDMTDATGLYLDGVLFALVSGGRLHFRTDPINREDYDRWEATSGRESEFFSGGLPAGGQKFRVVPPFVLDDGDTLAQWGRAAWEAAKRARVPAHR